MVLPAAADVVGVDERLQAGEALAFSLQGGGFCGKDTVRGDEAITMIGGDLFGSE
jgi:hypothetical protein